MAGSARPQQSDIPPAGVTGRHLCATHHARAADYNVRVTLQALCVGGPATASNPTLTSGLIAAAGYRVTSPPGLMQLDEQTWPSALALIETFLEALDATH